MKIVSIVPCKTDTKAMFDLGGSLNRMGSLPVECWALTDSGEVVGMVRGRGDKLQSTSETFQVDCEEDVLGRTVKFWRWSVPSGSPDAIMFHPKQNKCD